MRKDRLLEDSVAVVAGAGRGIGAAAAALLADHGAAVVLAARTTDEIEAAADRIRASGGTAVAVTTDIADYAHVQALMARALSAFGRIDVLVNCAAAAHTVGRPFWEADPQAWRRDVDANLVGPMCLIRAVLPHMLGRGTGRLINVSSPLGERVLPRAGVYGASRAGANHFMRVLAAELVGTGVTANTVFPGVVETAGMRRFRSSLLGTSSPGHGIAAHDPAVPAHLLLWMCAPATAWMNGATVDLDDPVVLRRLALFVHVRSAA